MLGEFCNTSANARYDFALFKHQRRYIVGCDFETVQWCVTSVLYGLLGAPIHTFRPRLVSEIVRSAHSLPQLRYCVLLGYNNVYAGLCCNRAPASPRVNF